MEKESFFGPPGQYGRLVIRANCLSAQLLIYLQLFTLLGCDDQPMMDHVNELLASLPEDADDSQEGENGNMEGGVDSEASSGEEDMDTQ